MQHAPRALTGQAILRTCMVKARRALIYSFVSAILRQLAFLAMPYLLGRAVDEGLVAGDDHALTVWVVCFGLAVLVEAVGVSGWMWWANLAEARLAAGLRADLLDVVLHSDATAGFATGDVVARAMDDVDRILRWVHGLTTWVVIAVTVVVLVPVIAAMDPWLLVVVVVCVSLLVAISVAMPRRLGPRLAAVAQAHGARSQLVEQLLSAAASLHGVGGQDVVVTRHDLVSTTVTRRVRSAARIRSAWDAMGEGMPVLAIGAGLAVAAGPAIAGRIGVGDLTSFALWMGTVQVATSAVVVRLGDHSEAVAGADRIATVLNQRRAQHGGSPDLHDMGSSLVLHEVRPPHGTAGPVNLRAEAGQWIAITGPTGSGKSSLLRSVAGRDRVRGSILIGQLDLSLVTSDDLPGLVRLVGQGARLLHGTVRDNLLLGCGPLDATEPDDRELQRLCRIAVFDEVLARLPAGLDTMIGERGSTLSGGEQQRLALARALVRPVPLLLLDDVSSSLDPGTEAELLTRLRVATGDRVVLWASHRTAVRDAADEVVVLEAQPVEPRTVEPQAVETQPEVTP